LRSATAALAIEQYRLDHGGALPDTLEQLVPQYLTSVPTDPFDGAPLVYERLPQKGYRVMGRAALARRNPTSSKTGKGAPAWKDVSISVFR
jgi:hypothetical protein